jgi:sporulation protein YtfJ
MADSKFSDIINASLQKVKEFSNSETVVGEPIKVGETTIIPVSRITMGFASGGIDYAGKKQKEGAPKPNNFGGGGGTGVNITPIAFLVINAGGSAEILPITGYTENDSVEKITGLIERSPDILSKIKDVFTKKKKEDTFTVDASENDAENA